MRTLRWARGAIILGSAGIVALTIGLWGNLGATLVAADDSTGEVTGQIVLDGDAAEAALLVKKGDAAAKDSAVCAAADVPSEAIVVDPKSKGLANVFVYLARAPKGMPASMKKSETKEVVFDQKGCRFLPHALFVRTDQTVMVKSDDAISHNTHTFAVRNPRNYNTAINPNERKGIPMTFTAPERLPTEVKCDIHPWMKAYWLILDHPYAAVTDAEGKFTIKGLPAGKHEFIIWQESAGYVDRKFTVTVKAGGTTEAPVVKVAASKLK